MGEKFCNLLFYQESKCIFMDWNAGVDALNDALSFDTMYSEFICLKQHHVTIVIGLPKINMQFQELRGCLTTETFFLMDFYFIRFHDVVDKVFLLSVHQTHLLMSIVRTTIVNSMSLNYSNNNYSSF